MFDVEAVRVDFPGSTQQVYLNAAGVGLPSRSALVAVQQVVSLLGQGPAEKGYKAYYRAIGEASVKAKEEAARLLRVTPAEIAFIDDTTMGLNIALAAIPFAPGDNLILCDLEYPQVAISASHPQLRQHMEIRVARHRNGVVTVDDYAKLIDQRTRAIVVSSVQWINGLRMDLTTLSQLAQDHHCFLVVDAIQQLGAIPLDLSALNVDFLAAGAQKWLNSPFGTGLLYIRKEVQDKLQPGLAHGLFAFSEPAEGWARYLGNPALTPFLSLSLALDARRFEIHGMPKTIGAAGLAAALAYVNALDTQAVTEHIMGLGDFLIEELQRRRIKVWTPADHRLRSGIITCEPYPDAERVHQLTQELEKKQIYPTVRYCSGIGGLRISIHYYTNRNDLEALLAAMDEIMKDEYVTRTMF
jgi:cysteine desulfurase/selenocysteine lyase